MSQMDVQDAYTDVVELCALLQCLGFSVKSLDNNDGNASQDGSTRTVVINCQSSGLHVVLESPGMSCSCPATNTQQNSGVWEVAGVTGGKQLDKEFGCSLLGSLPKGHRDRLTKDLREMIKCIKVHNESDLERPKDKEGLGNKSASMIELETPEKKQFPIKSETPTRYRSLDTLTAAKKVAESSFPTPGALHKALDTYTEDVKVDNQQSMCSRQSTYTLSSTPSSIRQRNKTSSPIRGPQTSLLESLVSARKTAEELCDKLACVIRDFVDDDGKNESSISLTLDVSKISMLKGAESSKAQFASSPNLSGLGTVHEDFSNKLKRNDSASTSNLSANKSSAKKDDKISRLRRISPSMFKSKKESPSNVAKAKTGDVKSKLTSLFRPKIVAPVRITRTEASPNLSGTRKKLYSHVKSTIPRPTTAKKE